MISEVYMKNIFYMTYMEYGNDSPLCHMAHKLTTGLSSNVYSSE